MTEYILFNIDLVVEVIKIYIKLNISIHRTSLYKNPNFRQKDFPQRLAITKSGQPIFSHGLNLLCLFGFYSFFYLIICLFYSPFSGFHENSKAYLWIFFILWTVQKRSRWIFTLLFPLRVNLSRPSAEVIWANTGSTVPKRLEYICLPTY